MRALLLTTLLLLGLGCAGGQTGEITMLGRCDEARVLGDLDVLDAEARARFDQATAELTGALTWELEEPSETTVTISAAAREGAVEEVGREACTRLRVPVDIAVATADGRFDAILSGTVELHSTGQATLRGDAPISTNGGDLDLEWLGPLSEGTFYAEIERAEGRSVGQIFVAPGGEQDEVRLAAF